MIRLPRACRGKTAVLFPANSSHMCCVELALKRLASADKGFPQSLIDGYAMLMSPSKGKTAVHGCHFPRYDCAHARGNGQAVGWCVCFPCFNLLLTCEPPSPRMLW